MSKLDDDDLFQINFQDDDSVFQFLNVSDKRPSPGLSNAPIFF